MQLQGGPTSYYQIMKKITESKNLAMQPCNEIIFRHRTKVSIIYCNIIRLS